MPDPVLRLDAGENCSGGSASEPGTPAPKRKIFAEFTGRAPCELPEDLAGPPGPPRSAARPVRLRQHVRAWINAWDLVRLDPGYEPDTEVVTLASSYDEDKALEADPAG